MGKVEYRLLAAFSDGSTLTNQLFRDGVDTDALRFEECDISTQKRTYRFADGPRFYGANRYTRQQGL